MYFLFFASLIGLISFCYYLTSKLLSGIQRNLEHDEAEYHRSSYIMYQEAIDKIEAIQHESNSWHTSTRLNSTLTMLRSCRDRHRPLQPMTDYYKNTVSDSTSPTLS